MAQQRIFNRFRTLALGLMLALPSLGALLLNPVQAQQVQAQQVQAQKLARPADSIAVQAVIRGQLEAFKKDDARKAFTYASLGIHQSFGDDALTFGMMVQQQYPMVYRPKSYKFDPTLELEGNMVQGVIIEDQEGMLVRAVYLLMKEGGAWKVGGVYLAPLEDEKTTDSTNVA